MIMKKILRKYPEAILTVLALVFLGIIFSYFSWGIGDALGTVNNALNPEIGLGQNIGFDVAGAQALDLRGLAKPQP